MAEIETAVRLNPTDLQSVSDLARVLAVANDPAVRNPKRAIAYAARADEGTAHHDPLAMGGLALAYAAAGRFDDAADVAGKAATAARFADMYDVADQLDSDAVIYQSHEVPN